MPVSEFSAFFYREDLAE